MLLVDIFFRSLKPQTKMSFKLQRTNPPHLLSPDGLQYLPLSKTEHQTGHAPANQLECAANQGVIGHLVPIYTTLIYVSLSHLKFAKESKM